MPEGPIEEHVRLFLPGRRCDIASTGGRPTQDARSRGGAESWGLKKLSELVLLGEGEGELMG